MLSESGDKQKKIVDNVDKSVYNCFFDEKQTKNNVDKSCVWVVVKLWIMCINEKQNIYFATCWVYNNGKNYVNYTEKKKTDKVHLGKL